MIQSTQYAARFLALCWLPVPPATVLAAWVCISVLMFLGTPDGMQLMADEPDVAVHFDGHVSEILKRNCWNCHGDSKQEAGLNLTSYESVLKGGSGGAVVVSGRASASRLLDVLIETDPEKRMPPDTDPLPSKEIAIIKKWIEAGLLENASSKGSEKATMSFVPRARTDEKSSEPIVPTGLEPLVQSKVRSPFPILALAVSSNAPVAAVSSFESVEFRRIDTNQSLGVVPFASGEPHVIRFSSSGAVLLVAGGRPVQDGAATLYDVQSGRKLTTLGNEADTIMAADISVDEKTVAIGGSGKTIKIVSTTDGKLISSLVKHTDWITSLSYSPDGKFLVSGDRIGNIYLWDAAQGGLLLPLAEHKGLIRSFAWRSDSQVLASCGEDGTIVWWDINKGFPIRSVANAHPPVRKPLEYGKIANGVLDVCFGPNGELASCGRDGIVRLWSSDGSPLKAFEFDKQSDALGNRKIARTAMPLRVGISHDGKYLIAGDSAGRIVTWNLATP